MSPHDPYMIPHDPYMIPHDPYMSPHDPYMSPHDPYMSPHDLLLSPPPATLLGTHHVPPPTTDKEAPAEVLLGQVGHLRGASIGDWGLESDTIALAFGAVLKEISVGIVGSF